MPSHFHSTIQSSGVRATRVAVELVREEERVRVAAAPRASPSGAIKARERVRIVLRVDVRVADQPLRDRLRVEPGVRGERARDSSRDTPDAEAAADQLDQQEAAVPVELVPVGDQARLHLGRIGAAQRGERATHSASPRSATRAGGGSTCASVSAKSPTAW
jgi:hypothetical protein